MRAHTTTRLRSPINGLSSAGFGRTPSPATRFDATIWPKGSLDFVIQPQMDSGNYFASQNRDAERYQLVIVIRIRTVEAVGRAQLQERRLRCGKPRPWTDRGASDRRRGCSGHLLERIAFTGAGSYNKSDTELAFYGQDHWILNPRLSFDLGLRTESQEISGTSRLAPGRDWHGTRSSGWGL